MFTLYNGKQYQSLKSDSKSKKDNEHVRMNFLEWEKTLDLSGFQMSHTSEELFQNHFKMMNVQQLEHAIDSIEAEMEGTSNSLQPSLSANYYLYRKNAADIQELPVVEYESFLQMVPDTVRQKLISKTLQTVRGGDQAKCTSFTALKTQPR